MKLQSGNMNHNGLTLIELLIVMSTISILAAIGLGSDGYFNSKDVAGHLESVTPATPSGSIVSVGTGAPVFQANVAIKQDNGMYIYFSTEDRQWASFEGDKAKGKCVKAKIYPYAPWQFSKAGIYHRGRLLSVNDCK